MKIILTKITIITFLVFSSCGKNQKNHQCTCTDNFTGDTTSQKPLPSTTLKEAQAECFGGVSNDSINCTLKEI
jgi:hypothetical protein